MSGPYTILIHLINDTTTTTTIVEQTTWAGTDTIWNSSDTGFKLSMKNSGTSGALRIKTSAGEYFTVATGVHNYKRWCEVLEVADNQALTTGLHANYYKDGDARHKALWAQASEHSVTLKTGRKVGIKFYVAEGSALVANLTYA